MYTFYSILIFLHGIEAFIERSEHHKETDPGVCVAILTKNEKLRRCDGAKGKGLAWTY